MLHSHLLISWHLGQARLCTDPIMGYIHPSYGKHTNDEGYNSWSHNARADHFPGMVISLFIVFLSVIVNMVGFFLVCLLPNPNRKHRMI